MFVLGVNLPERKLVKIALLRFAGIGHHRAKLICSRLSLHDQLKIGDLNDHQISRLIALLSNPSTQPPAPRPIAPFHGIPAPSSLDLDSPAIAGKLRMLAEENDPLKGMLLENDLRREVRANIAHHRAIGSYKGRRHAMGFPVRGQRTHTNAQTAKRLNRVERQAFSTFVAGSSRTQQGAAHSPSPSSNSWPARRTHLTTLLHAVNRSHGFAAARNA